jgi:uncharacterized protein YkwD
MRLPPSATFVLIAALPAAAMGQTLHSFGNPSAHEQAYLEMINRARANPGAEAELLAASTHPGVVAAVQWAGVNLTRFRAEMNAIPAQPPLAPHAALMTSSRGHSQWMFDNARQEHDQTGGQSFEERLSAVGYSGNPPARENVYTYAQDPLHGHAGFEIDWADPKDSTATFGMQNPRGHRENIHSGDYREVGIGVVNGTNTVNGNTVGPQIVTQDFGNRVAAPYYGTGVAYYDLDGDNNYDVGEGIPGLTVTMSGANHYCITADGGGWTIPLPSGAAGNRTVTFTGAGINQSITLNVPSNSNAKADLKLNYAPPTFISPTLVQRGRPSPLQVHAIPGANAYLWKELTFGPSSAINCDSITDQIVSTSFAVPNSAIKSEGLASWQLQFKEDSPADQTIQLARAYRVGAAGGSVNFMSRLRHCMTTDACRLQVRPALGGDWVDVYTQNGTGTSGESSFVARSVNLGAFSNQFVYIRFVLKYGGDSYYYGPSNTTGWFIDNLTFSDLEEVSVSSEGLSGATNFSINTNQTDTTVVQVNPLVGSYVFPGASEILQVSDTTSFAGWAAYHESIGGLTGGALTANSDPDGDGRSSALEFAFGTNPVVADGVPSGYPSIQPSATHFVLRYEVDTALNGLTVTPEAGTSATAWYAPGQPGAPPWFTDSLISTSGTLQTREAKVPFSSGARGFLRLRVMVP